MAHLDGSELDTLWDFTDPPTSEQRLRQAATIAAGAAADELRTQIARALGLQGNFAEALTMLDGITSDDNIVLQRLALERGRVHNSAGDVAAAIPCFREAHYLAADPFLTVDAIHMLATTDIAHAQQWYEEGLALSHGSNDPRVRRWEGSLRNNHAWHLVDTNKLAEALPAFCDAADWFRTHGTAQQLHIARWSVAHVLRRLGEYQEAREILLDLRAHDNPDPHVDEELALLGE